MERPRGHSDESAPAGRFRVLAIDDQPEVLKAVGRLLRSRGFDVYPQSDPRAGLAELEANPFGYDLVMLDLNMPGMSGLELLPLVHALVPDLPVVMLTGDASAKSAVAAMKAGAYGYLTKPLDDPDAVALTLSRAASYNILQRRARELEARISASERFATLVGATAPMRALLARIERVAATEVSVLIAGESGTGKELVARAIHTASARAERPFVAVNCGAIPESLIDSELFGHERGAFTGADSARPGMFREADGGTLFLDEIGDIPLPVQARLLRALQEREIRSVGGSGTRPVDVRVVAASHVDLEEAVARKQFREDLFYRLNVIQLQVPSLRDRADDVALLAVHFLGKHAERLGRTAPTFTNEAIRLLEAYSWPGNVRELENAVQHAIALVPGEVIDADALPSRVQASAPGPAPAPSPTPGAAGAITWADELSFRDASERARHEFERAYMVRLLERTEGNLSEAARQAGLDRSNFRRTLARLGLDAESFRPS